MPGWNLPVKRCFALRVFCLFAALILLGSCTERRQTGMLDRAERALSENNFAQGIELLKRVVEMDPESRTAVKAYYRLGFALETHLSDFEGAVLAYEEYIKHSQDAVSIYEVQKRIANIYFQHLLEPDKAAEAYGKLLLLSPDSLEADLFVFRQAQAYFRMNQFEKSRKQFQELIERFPKSQYLARSRYAVGNTYFMEGRYEVAVEALKQVLRHHSHSEYAIEAQFLMAQCLEHLGRLQKALEMYRALETRYTVPEVLALRIQEVQKRMRAKK